MRKFLVVLLLVSASAAVAKDLEFEEFGPSEARVRSVSDRGAMALDPGTYDAPVVAALPAGEDAALRPAFEVRRLTPRAAAGTHTEAVGPGYELRCWFSPY